MGTGDLGTRLQMFGEGDGNFLHPEGLDDHFNLERESVSEARF